MKQMSMKFPYLVMLVGLTLLIAGCASQDFSEVKQEENVGDTVMVRGVVEDTVKIGDLSGFTLSDSTGDTIAVSSESLPPEGDKITVRGTLLQDTLIGYYIEK